MPQDEPIGSPLWWLKRLVGQLEYRIGTVVPGPVKAGVRVHQRVDSLTLLQRYLDGDHRLQFASAEFLAAFGGLFRELSDNFMPLVVNTTNDRLHVEGFRFGTAADEAGRRDVVQADADANEIWQRNALDLYSELAHREAMGLGYAAAIVWAGADGEPTITFESPFEIAYERMPGGRRLAAAVKVWRDDWTGQRFATLYLPDGIFKFQTRKSSTGAFTASRWDKRSVEGEEWPIENPLGRVPVVPYENEPDLSGTAHSDIADLIPIQDAINFYTASMLVAAEFAGFRQRWATGIEIPKDPKTGKPIEPFSAAVKHLWTSADKDAKFGDFEVTELSNYTRAIEVGVQHLATRSSTPPHYLYQMAQIPSGESIKSAEAGLVAKSNRKARWFGEAHEETMRLAFAVLGDARQNAFGAETIWRDTEFRTEGEHVDALLKLQTLGVPNRTLWEKYGFTPAEIARMEAQGAPGGPDVDDDEPAGDEDELPPADGAAAIAVA